MMVHNPPSGARDLLPLDVAQKQWIERRVQQVFESWGYHRIITSTLEHLDTLTAGGAVRRSTTIQFQDSDKELLGLRPELTASIARAAATRLTGASYPQRLYYNANVFRQDRKSALGSQHEFYQAGVELIGAGGAIADAEILLLLGDCVRRLGIERWSLVLGEAGFTRSLLDPFPAPMRDRVRHAIAHLDRVAIEHLPLSDSLRDRALFLMDLRGRPEDVLQRVAQLELGETERNGLERLKSAIEVLRECGNDGTPLQEAIVLDLSLIQPFDYYTGVVFEVVGHTDDNAVVLGQGGRYDQLLGLYHPEGETAPGIGFSLNIEDLHRVLLPTGQLPDRTRASHYLVVPKTERANAAALAYACKLRQSDGMRVEIELGVRQTPEAIRDYARDRAIGQIAWMAEDGTPEIEAMGDRSSD